MFAYYFSRTLFPCAIHVKFGQMVDGRYLRGTMAIFLCGRLLFHVVSGRARRR